VTVPCFTIDLCDRIERFPDLDGREVLDAIAGRARGRHIDFAIRGVPYRNRFETAAAWLSRFPAPPRPLEYLGDAQRALELQAAALDGFGSELLADEDERWALYRARREFFLRRDLDSTCPPSMKPMLQRARSLIEQAADLVSGERLEELRRDALLLDDLVLAILRA